MKTFRMYIKPSKSVNIGKMREKFAKSHNMTDSVIENGGTDPLGMYLTFHVPNTMKTGEVQKYRNVVKVLDMTPSNVQSFFKAYMDEPIDSFHDMQSRYGLEVKESGTEKTGWPLKRERNYLILEGTEHVYPEQIASYPGISKAERIDQNIVDIGKMSSRRALY